MRWWPYCPRSKHLCEPSSDTIYLNQDIVVFSLCEDDLTNRENNADHSHSADSNVPFNVGESAETFRHTLY